MSSSPRKSWGVSVEMTGPLLWWGITRVWRVVVDQGDIVGSGTLSCWRPWALGLLPWDPTLAGMVLAGRASPPISPHHSQRGERRLKRLAKWAHFDEGQQSHQSTNDKLIFVPPGFGVREAFPPFPVTVFVASSREVNVPGSLGQLAASHVLAFFSPCF